MLAKTHLATRFLSSAPSLQRLHVYDDAAGRLYYNEHTAGGYGELKTEVSFWPSSGAAPNSALAATEMGQTRFPACFIFRPCMHASRQCMRTYLAPSADTQRNKGALIGSTAAADV
jgi:hypothetical protein